MLLGVRAKNGASRAANVCFLFAKMGLCLAGRGSLSVGRRGQRGAMFVLPKKGKGRSVFCFYTGKVLKVMHRFWG